MDEELQAYLEPEGLRRRRTKYICYSDEVARAFLRRIISGEAVISICRDAEMPSEMTLRRWRKQMPEFARRMDLAKQASGRLFKEGGQTIFCEATAAMIFDRLLDGEGLKSICRDPAMPSLHAVYRWLREREDFREAYRLARTVQGDALAEEGWTLARAGTPETAFLTHVQLTHLRWYAGKLEPRRWGTVKAVEAEPERPAGPAAEPGHGDGPDGVKLYEVRYIYDLATGETRPTGEEPKLLQYGVAGDMRKTEYALEQERRSADARKAYGEAGVASLEAGVAVNGVPQARFYPAWYAELYPDEMRQKEMKEAADAQARARREAESAAFWAAKGVDPQW
ncbi:hypothetical protein [Phenylobacterium sp.]|jgi:hypothetical protein|uniref:terminase small subunit-like protein n=1 Tax=Phenylobacterium sp. TaxID=1871053 RepID=UPI002F9297A6